MADRSGSISSSSSGSMIIEYESGEEEGEASEGVHPYMFEPEGSISGSNSGNEDSDVEVELRTMNDDWCECGGHCQRQDTERECVCCKEIDNVVRKNSSSSIKRNISVPECITLNPAFLVVCTDSDVLETAWYAYRQQFGGYDGPEHKRLRHIAYRQFVRWCWGWLGRNIRVVLPACVVSCIRAHFPPPGLEENFTFEGFHFSDE